jgi:hypothetical protein
MAIKFIKILKFIQVIIEKTPAYFTANPKVPKRVFDFNPKMRFILIIREPVMRTSQLHIFLYFLIFNEFLQSVISRKFSRPKGKGINRHWIFRKFPSFAAKMAQLR